MIRISKRIDTKSCNNHWLEKDLKLQRNFKVLSAVENSK